MVLPDLVKNARKDWNPRPERKQTLFTGDEKLFSLLEGWKRHLAVDKHFHSSDFFCSHTRTIKSIIVPVLENSLARPSFVAHIALELMLDSLLLTEGIIEAGSFYEALSDANRPAVEKFLRLNGITDTALFFHFLDNFISSEYLNAYRDHEHIVYALGRICMRIWTEPFTESQKLRLTEVLVAYIDILKGHFLSIFLEIEEKLTPYTGS